MAFGGGGGLHAAPLMRELNIPRAVVPSNPGALSATGMLGTDYRNDRSRTMVRAVETVAAAELEQVFAELEQEAAGALTAEGVPAATITVQRSADLRYTGQEYHLNITCPPPGDAVDIAGLAPAFNAAHERVYGYSTPEFSVQLVGLRVIAIGHTERPPIPHIEARPEGGPPKRHAVRKVYFTDEGWIDAAIYVVGDVGAGDVIEGPAILEDPRSTMLILPGQAGTVDRFGNLHIEERAQ